MQSVRGGARCPSTGKQRDYIVSKVVDRLHAAKGHIPFLADHALAPAPAIRRPLRRLLPRPLPLPLPRLLPRRRWPPRCGDIYRRLLASQCVSCTLYMEAVCAFVMADCLLACAVHGAERVAALPRDIAGGFAAMSRGFAAPFLGRSSPFLGSMAYL